MKDQTKVRKKYYNNVRERIKKFQSKTEPEYSELLKRIERYTENVANQVSDFFDIEYEDTYQECYLHMYNFWKTFDVNSDDTRIGFCNTLAKAYSIRWAIRSLLLDHIDSVSKIEKEFYENKNKDYKYIENRYTRYETPFSSMDRMICYYNLGRIEEELFHKQRKKFIEDVLETITPREKRVLKRRFFDGHTLEEIGAELDRSRDRIRQIEAKALRKLRHPSRSRMLKGFLELDYMYPKGFILENLLEREIGCDENN